MSLTGRSWVAVRGTRRCSVVGGSATGAASWVFREQRSALGGRGACSGKCKETERHRLWR